MKLYLRFPVDNDRCSHSARDPQADGIRSRDYINVSKEEEDQ